MYLAAQTATILVARHFCLEFLLVLSLQTIPSAFALLIPTQVPTRFGNGHWISDALQLRGFSNWLLHLVLFYGIGPHFRVLEAYQQPWSVKSGNFRQSRHCFVVITTRPLSTVMHCARHFVASKVFYWCAETPLTADFPSSGHSQKWMAKGNASSALAVVPDFMLLLQFGFSVISSDDGELGELSMLGKLQKTLMRTTVAVLESREGKAGVTSLLSLVGAHIKAVLTDQNEAGSSRAITELERYDVTVTKTAIQVPPFLLCEIYLPKPFGR